MLIATGEEKGMLEMSDQARWHANGSDVSSHYFPSLAPITQCPFSSFIIS